MARVGLPWSPLMGDAGGPNDLSSNLSTPDFNVGELPAAAAFAQELLVFHLHSTDHMGVEGQFHWLLQAVIAVTLAATLLWFACPGSFAVSLVRSASIVLQGVWFIVMGVMLWTPGLISKGCFINLEEGHNVVRCRTDEALHRAVPRQPAVQLLTQLYHEEPRYLPLVKTSHADGRSGSVEDDDGDDDDDHVEAAKRTFVHGHVVRGTH
ncbi:hypothetical protein TRIUR3_08109 [Triticum urartu]|uniref:Uncharacterized protein n=1 Tax=Triticum urartu TaxID=4572 RepID=M8A162_TRIUA|nr:hypothetical protein TRIUR3_08109 [Triticum urartu]